jgi:hypothetical protein
MILSRHDSAFGSFSPFNCAGIGNFFRVCRVTIDYSVVAIEIINSCH